MKAEDVEKLCTEAAEAGRRLQTALHQRIFGQDEAIEQLVIALFCGGHVLIEGAPGLGKTTLVQTLASSVDLTFRRIQFTPDLMPADILGARVLEPGADGARSFRFHPGPIFTHVLLADELNRATPRTQAALLEAMAEGQVTSFGDTHPLPKPFLVAATQNPIEMEGTYPLPEAQLDRFQLQLEIHMPALGALVQLLEASASTKAPVQPLMSRESLLQAQALVREIPISSELIGRVARLLLATHPEDAASGPVARRLLRHGASPRGGQSLLLAAKARALLQGRLHVTREDLEKLYFPALRHRVVAAFGVEPGVATSREALQEAWSRT
jgi:MoxR-like ATPase